MIKHMTIQEVSERTGVTCHTLRFWERELGGIIVPLRSKGGQRRYTIDHLAIIEEIKRHKMKGLSLPDIKNALQCTPSTLIGTTEDNNIDLLANRIIEVVRSTVYDFFERKPIR